MTNAPLPTVELAEGYRVPRLIRGGWQWHERARTLDRSAALNDLMDGWHAGLRAVEASDNYDGVEELLGDFRARLKNEAGIEEAASLRVHTRVTQIGASPLTRESIIATVDRSRRRLRQDRLDLVQLQWWNLESPGWREAALVLDELRREGRIGAIGVTNLPASAVLTLLDDGVPISTCQVQISLLDPRALQRLAPLCGETGIKLLGYGPLAGGFLTEAWLGRADPGTAGASGTVYRRLIDRFGGWDWFQSLLVVLDRCARRHRIDIAAVSLGWVLREPTVAAILVGLSDARRVERYRPAFTLAFERDEIIAIRAILDARGPIDGDVADFERTELQNIVAQSYAAATA